MNGDRQDNSFARSPGDDPRVTHLLRCHCAPPTDADYWSRFEERMLARLRESAPVTWWSVFSEWRAAGMVAAAAAVFVAGATLVREQQFDAAAREQAAVAAEFIVFDSLSDPVNIAITQSSAGGKPTRPAVPERYLDLIRP